MCAREASTTPDSSRLQTFRNLGDCLRSESSYCKSRHTCCSPASCIRMAYLYKASTARTCLKYLSCMRQSPIICTHAWPSCHFDLSTYNNLTLPHLGFFLGHNKTAGCIDGQISMFPNAFGNSWTRKIKCDEPSEIGLKSSANRAEEALKNAEEADRFG